MVRGRQIDFDRDEGFCRTAGISQRDITRHALPHAVSCDIATDKETRRSRFSSSWLLLLVTAPFDRASKGTMQLAVALTIVELETEIGKDFIYLIVVVGLNTLRQSGSYSSGIRRLIRLERH